MKFVFFRTPKPRQFNYRPIYYDPEKEAAEERKKAWNSPETMDPKERMRAEIRRRWKTEPVKENKSAQMIRIVIYALFAFFAIYVIFFTDLINNLVSAFLR